MCVHVHHHTIYKVPRCLFEVVEKSSLTTNDSVVASLVCNIIFVCPEPVFSQTPWICLWTIEMSQLLVTEGGVLSVRRMGPQALHTFHLVSFSCEASVIHNTVTLFRNVSLDSISESLSRGIFKQSLDLCMRTCSL